jgi:16S rRNA (adenine1518-N6/adenine1519-N6)-dimethyltransferase
MPDELLDIINSDDIVIAQEMRSVVHQRGLLHRGVHIFLITPDGKLLVQQRSRQRDNNPLALDCSVSEHVKANESYEQAARRGLAEEMGVQAAALHALVKFNLVYGINDFETSVLYEGRVDPTQVRFDPVEVEKIACYRLDELDVLIGRDEVAFSSWFVQLIHWYLGKPSELKVISTYSYNRLLLPGNHSR